MGRDAKDQDESRLRIRPFDDGLVLPEVGKWSKDKHHFLGRYLSAFTTAMRNKGWSSLNYLDLFAAAGFAKIKGTGEVIAGSPVIAANVRYPFDSIICAEKDSDRCEALRTRLARQRIDSAAKVYQGDANEIIAMLVGDLPQRSLSVAFVDPYGLHFDFETMRSLAQHSCDVILFFPDHLDAVRNWRTYYHRNPDSNLDRFLGTDWRPAIEACPDGKHAEVVRDLYAKQHSQLGFAHFEYQRICDEHGRPLYLLIYASKSQVGAKIWRGISKIDSSGQRELFD